MFVEYAYSAEDGRMKTVVVRAKYLLVRLPCLD